MHLEPLSHNSRISGDNNIVVQIAGHHNVVTISKSDVNLELTRYVAQRVTPTSDLDYLNPYTMGLPLIGRSRELAVLGAWLAADRKISVTALSGAGGSGKTRLALELCDASAKSGWDAGFLEGRALRRFMAQKSASSWSWQKPTLIVVDDAASNGDALAPWLEELADNPVAGAPDLRILFLERSATSVEGWWARIAGDGGWKTRAVQRLLEPRDPIVLSDLTPLDQQALLDEVIRRTSCVNSQQELFASVDIALQEQEWATTPIYLVMAGLLAAKYARPHLLSLNRTDLAMELAGIEQGRLSRLARAAKIEPSVLLTLVASITLARGIDEPTLPFILSHLRQMKRSAQLIDDSTIVTLLKDGLPTVDQQIHGISPDILGEAFLLSATRPNELSQLARDAASYSRIAVATTLIYVAHDFPDSDRLHEVLEALEATTFGSDVSPEEREQISYVCPDDSGVLGRFSLRLSGEVVAGIRKGEIFGTLFDPLMELAYRQADLGEHEAALKSVTEALQYAREAQSFPNAHNRPRYRVVLQDSLGMYANELHAVGRSSEAIQAAKEGIALRREGTRGAPYPELNLAIALNSLGKILNEAGQEDEAINAAQESVMIYRGLSLTSSSHLGSFTTALLNYGNRLYEAERYAEAASVGRECLSIRRELAAHNADSGLYDLAYILHNMGFYLAAIGEWDEALSHVMEAIGIRRRLYRLDPEVYGPNLVSSLDVAASRLQHLGRLHESSDYKDEARSIKAELARRH